MGYLNEDGLATLVGKVKGQVVQLTSAEYRALPASKNTDNKTYFVTDEDYAYAIDDEPTLNSDNLVKSGGVYTYTSKIGSGTLTTTAQTIIPAINELDAAIDENRIEINNLKAGLIDELVTKTMSWPGGVSGRDFGTYTKSGYTLWGVLPVSLARASTTVFTFQTTTAGLVYMSTDSKYDESNASLTLRLIWKKNQ